MSSTADEWGGEAVEREPLPELYDIREAPLVGVYVSSRTTRVRDTFHHDADGKREVSVHTFMYGDGSTVGKLVSVFGKPDLDGKLSQIAPGDVCRIEYLGQEDIGNGKKLSKFDIRRRPGTPETLERAARATAAATSHAPDGAAGTDDDIPF